ncbi:MAG: serine hydrolase domain-containing protein [Pseudomonadota bacterium]
MLTACAYGAGAPAPSCSAEAAYAGPPPVDVPVVSQPAPVDTTRRAPADVAAELQGVFEKTFARTQATAASVAIYSETHGFWRSDIGLEAGEPDAFWLASIAKLPVASIIIQMIEEGKISYDDRLDIWLPDLPNASLVTIDDLLTHKSGLRDLQHDPAWRSRTGYKSLRATLDYGETQESQFCPGTNWAYSNFGYVVLGAIAEKIEGEPLAEIFKMRIAAPLGLTSLQWVVPETDRDAIVSGVPASTTFVEGIAGIHGAGAMAGDTTDLLRLLAAYLAGDIISEESLRATRATLYPLFSQDMSYGRGVMMTRVPDPDAPAIWIGHAGGAANAKALVAYDVSRRAYIAVNLNTNAPAEAIANMLLKALDHME